MIIKKISIENFGKLSCVELDFSNGLNLIYAPNESGKTTILAFIKYMFYGTKIKKKKDDLYFKEKYMPWNSSPMSGSIEFEHDSKSYYIYRSEGLKNGGKIYSIKNAFTGEECRIDEPGKYFFGVSESAFSDSCFVGEIPVRGEGTEIVSSFSDFNIDEKSYSFAKKKLEEKIQLIISLKRKESEISVISNKKNKIISDILKCEKLLEDMNSLNEKKDKLFAKLHMLEDEIVDLTAQKKAIESYEMYTRYKKLKQYVVNEKKNSLALVDRLNEVINIPFDNVQKDSSKNKVFIKNAFLLLLCMSVIAFGTFVVIGMKQVYLYSSIILCLFSFLGFVFSMRITSEKLQDKKDENDKKEFDKKFLVNTLEKQIYLSNTHISEAEEEIKNIELSGKLLSNHVEQDNFDINCFTNEEINDIIISKGKERESLLIDIAKAETETAGFHKLREEYEFLKSELDVICKKETEVFRRADVYKTGLDILECAFSKLKNSFIPNVSARAYEIFSSVSQNDAVALLSDESFNASVKVNNEFKDSKYLSMATNDLLYLSLRIAVCDFCGTKQTLPMFFDDILASFDDMRAEKMSKIIMALSEKRQIFMCTCRSRDVMFYNENKQVNIINI